MVEVICINFIYVSSGVVLKHQNRNLKRSMKFGAINVKWQLNSKMWLISHRDPIETNDNGE